MTETPWLTTADVAARVQLSVHTVRDACERGELAGCKVRKQWRFTAADVDAWIESYRVAPVARPRRRSA